MLTLIIVLLLILAFRFGLKRGLLMTLLSVAGCFFTCSLFSQTDGRGFSNDDAGTLEKFDFFRNVL